jgi:hypothetical protein
MDKCLGVDLGNVIIDHLGFGTTNEFVQTGDYNIIPPVPGVMEALAGLNQASFNGNIFVVYKATDVAEEKILAWMKHHNFYERTGVPSSRIHRTQFRRDKSSLCEKHRATHFIDDRLEVLGHLVGKVRHLYLFRPQREEVLKFKQTLRHIQQVVMSWDEILKALLP